MIVEEQGIDFRTGVRFPSGPSRKSFIYKDFRVFLFSDLINYLIRKYVRLKLYERKSCMYDICWQTVGVYYESESRCQN